MSLFSATPKDKINRDDFVNALSVWLRWRGHTLPHDLLSQRIPQSEDSDFIDWKALGKHSEKIGLGLTYAKAEKLTVALEPESFPRIAVFENGHIKAIRGITETNQLLFNATGKDDSVGNRADVVGWISLDIDSRQLHQEIFGNVTSEKSWLKKIFVRHWFAFMQVAIAAALSSVLAVAGSLYAMQVYDRVLPSDSTNTLVVLTTGVLIVYLLDFLLRTIRAFILDFASKKIDLTVSEKVFSQAVGVRMEARPAHLGTFISQLREHETIREFLLSSTIFLLADLPFMFIFLFVIWVIAGPVVYAPIIAIPLVVIVTLLIQLPLKKLSRANIKENNARSGLLIESVEGAETLKTLNAEWRMRRRWHELTDLVSDTGIKMKRLSSLSVNFTQMVSSMMYAGVIVIGALLVREGGMTAGALIASTILSSRALQPVTQFVSLLTRLYQVQASSEIIDQIMTMPIDRPSHTNFLTLDRYTGSLSLQNVEFYYGESDIAALQVPQLAINAGERIAVLGRTGSGKSTLVRLLSGLYMPTKGRVLMDNVDVQQIDPTRFRKTIGYLTQDVRLFAGTLKENLLLGAGDVTDDDLVAASRAAGIDRYVSQHPQGYDLPIFEGGGGLSGGQRQALGFARLLLSKPLTYLLDEPTASMDQQTEKEVIQNIQGYLKKESTLVVVTHKPSILTLVDRIIVMDQGRIVMDGPKEEIMRQLNANQQQQQTQKNKATATATTTNAGQQKIIVT